MSSPRPPTVVDVAHDRDDRGTQHQVVNVFIGDQIGTCLAGSWVVGVVVKRSGKKKGELAQLMKCYQQPS